MALDLSPANRKYRMTFERSVSSRDAMNALVEKWGSIGQRWAAISFATGQERRVATQEAGSAAATFGVLKDEITRTLTLRDRVQFDGAAWDISSIVPAGEVNEGYEITGTRAT